MPYRVSIKQFKGVWDYCAYWDKMVQDCIASNTEYSRELLNYRQYIEDKIKNDTEREKIDWLGFPIPLSWQDAMDRRTYLNMELFKNKYEEIKPFFSLLEKISNSIIPKDVIKPNDRGLGVFSIDRALMSPDKTLGLWSEKKQKFFFLGDGDMVLEKDGKEKRKKIKIFGEEQEAIVFKLKEDGSEAYLTQIHTDISYSSSGKAEGGEKEWGSLNKKSFLYKEKHPRPQRSVRIFVTIGGNSNKTELYWAGIGATMVAQFLMSKGYAVRITGVISLASTYSRSSMQISDNAPFNFKEGRADGYRIHLFDVKKYDEELDTLGLLYPIADQSFFRVRIFDYYFTQQWLNGDILNTGLYYTPPFSDTQYVVEEKIKSNEIEQEKDTLYYFIGGDDVTSLEGIQDNLAYIVCDAERRNAELLAKMGVEFVPTSFSDISVGTIDCDDILRRFRSNP